MKRLLGLLKLSNKPKYYVMSKLLFISFFLMFFSCVGISFGSTTITSPNNTTWIVGSTQEITWDTDYEEDYIWLRIDKGPYGGGDYIVNERIENDGSFMWNIGTEFSLGYYTISLMDGSGEWREHEYFTLSSNKEWHVANGNDGGEGSLRYCIENSEPNSTIIVPSNMPGLNDTIYPESTYFIDHSLTFNFNSTCLKGNNQLEYDRGYFYIGYTYHSNTNIDLSFNNVATKNLNSPFIQVSEYEKNKELINKITLNNCGFHNSSWHKCLLIRADTVIINNCQFKTYLNIDNYEGLNWLEADSLIDISNCHFEDNMGGFGLVKGKNTFINIFGLRNNNIDKCDMGCVSIEANDSINCKSISFFQNENGNGIRLYSENYAKISGSFKYNTIDGILLYLDCNNGSGVIENCNFYENHARQVLECENYNNGKHLINNCNFEKQNLGTSEGFYSSIFSQSSNYGESNITLNDCNFEENHFIGVLSNCIIDNCDFRNNESPDEGSYKFFEINGKSEVKNSFFIGNYNHISSGGALSINKDDGADTVSIIDSEFRNNVSNKAGGAIFSNNGTFIRNSDFRSNEALIGGAIQGFEIIIDSSIFWSNNAIARGGAIEGTKMNISNCLFKYNRVNEVINSDGFSNGGGAIFTYTLYSFGDIDKPTIGDLTVINECNFFDNESVNDGGAIHVASIFYNKQALLNITKCNFFGNKSNKKGACIRNVGSKGEIINSVFIYNYSENSSAIVSTTNTGTDPNDFEYQDRSSLVFTNCTLHKNKGVESSTSSGNFWLSGDDVVRNSIIVPKTGEGSIENEKKYYYNCAVPEYNELNNYNVGVDFSSLFENEFSSGGDNDWDAGDAIDASIKLESGLVNMGSNEFSSNITTDIYGNQRILNGTVDIGAVEYNINSIAVFYQDSLRYKALCPVDFGNVVLDSSTSEINLNLTSFLPVKSDIVSIYSSDESFKVEFAPLELVTNEIYKFSILFEPQEIGKKQAEVSIDYNYNNNSNTYIFKVLGKCLAPYLDTTSVKSSSLIDIKLYPNPVRSKLFLNYKFSDANYYSVYDLYGKCVIQGVLKPYKCSIDVDSLNKGFYLLSILKDGKRVNSKFIKE